MSGRRVRLYLAGSAVAIVAVVVTAGLTAGRFFERQILTHEEEHTATAIEYHVRQHLEPADFARPAAAGAPRRFETMLGDLNSVFRLKAYGADGRVVWSNERRLIGLAFPENGRLAAAFAGAVVTVLSEPRASEHLFERDRGAVAETYVPITFAGDPRIVGVIEAYRDTTASIADIRRVQTLIWSVAGTGGVLVWTALAVVVWQATASERRTARRLAKQNDELMLLQTFTSSVLRPLTRGDVPASVVATTGAGLGLVRTALFRVEADAAVRLRASWPAGERVEPPPPEVVRSVVDERREAVAGPVAILPLETEEGVDHVFVAVFPHAVSGAERPALATLRIMVAEAAIALANVALYTKIREAHERLAAIVAGIADRMIIVDDAMRIVWTNAAATDALGGASAAGQSCFTVFGETAACASCPAARALETARVERGVRAVPSAAGTRYLDLVAAPLRDASGRVYQVLEMARDITDLVEMEERVKQWATRLEASHAELLAKAHELEHANRALREAQAQLVAAERLAAVGEVVVGLHHAILNPLAGALGALQVAKQEPRLPARTRGALEDAEQEVRRIEALVRRLPNVRRTDGTPYVGRTTMLDVERALGDSAAS